MQRAGSDALDSQIEGVTTALLATIDKADAPDRERGEAAARLVLLRPADLGVVNELLGRINARTSPDVAAGLLAAVAQSNAKGTAEVILDKVGTLPPAVREAAFRTAKSDLGLRPIYHHLQSRVDAHILVCFLALALWRTLEQWMSAKGLGSCARKLIDSISTIKSMDVILPVERSGLRTDLRLRVVAKPEKDTAQLLAHLGLQIPRQSKIIENVVPKID